MRQDQDRQYQKRAKEKMDQMMDMQSSLGFKGVDLFGKLKEHEDDDFSFELFANPNETRTHLNPQSYTTNQATQYNNDQVKYSIYDGTGRETRSLEIKELLARAKKVIQRDKEHELKGTAEGKSLKRTRKEESKKHFQ